MYAYIFTRHKCYMIHPTNFDMSLISSAVRGSFPSILRCPPLQTQQVVCPILVLHLGQVCPQDLLWAPAQDQTHHQALFTVWWDPALDLGHLMYLMACSPRDKVITLRTACTLCIRYFAWIHQPSRWTLSFLDQNDETEIQRMTC